MKKLGRVLLFLSLLLLLTGCDTQKGRVKGIDKLVFVVQKNVHKNVTNQLKDLIARVKKETGVEIPLETSGRYEKKRGTTEILIGETDREISQKAYAALPLRGYLMKYADDSLVIAGTNDAMLSYAISEFCSLYIDKADGIDLRSLKETDQDSSKKTIVTLLENNTCDYSVVVPQDSDSVMSKAETNNGIDLEVNYMFRIMDVVEGITKERMLNTTFEESDANRKEIMIGAFDREEASAVRQKWAVNEYGVLCPGSKIIIGGWNLETLSLAGDAFLDLMEMGTVREKNNKTAIYFIDDQLECLSTDQWNLDIPAYDGGALSGTNDAAYGQFMWYITETDETEFDAYIKKLEKAGYTLSRSNEIAGSLYRTYVKGDVLIHAYYTPNDHAVRIVDGSIKQTGLVKDIEPKGEKVSEFSVIQLPLTYEEHVGGMSYVLTLEDGRFVIIDGGSPILKDATRLYDVLEKTNKRTDGIVIAAWFFSHEHDDHYGVFEKFMGRYGRRVTIENVYCNIPSDSFEYNSYNLGTFMTMEYPQIAEKYGNFPLTVVHSGQRFKIGNADFEILYTCEDLYPMRKFIFNDMSVVIRVSTEGGSVLFLGDAADATSEVLCSRFGTALQSDVVQMAHHGWNGTTFEVYELSHPRLIMWPNSRSEYEKCRTGTNPEYRIINSKVVSMVGEKNIYVADDYVWQFTPPYTAGTILMEE